MSVKEGKKLRDVLSWLSYANVRKLLGPSCDALLREGGRMEIDMDSQVRLDARRFTLTLGPLRPAAGGRSPCYRRSSNGPHE